MSIPRFVVSARVPTRAPVLGVPVFSDLTTPDDAGAKLDTRFLAQRGFEGKPGQALALLADDRTTVVALGVGDKRSVDAATMRRAGAALARQVGSATRAATTLMTAAGDPELASALVEGIALGAYRYAGAAGLKAGRKPLELVTVVGAGREAVRRGELSAAATWRARDWVNTPARDMTPTELAKATVDAASGTGVEVDVWDEKRIEAERLGGLMGVAAGAFQPPRLLRLSYEPEGARASVALVGKGVTFDSGGLSLKSAAGMMTMKSDMGGAAAVINATIAVAELGVPVRVTGWVAATENMPSGTAIHPGDVLVARNGKSIEVLNTDAEGRLVLADALSLAAEEEPDAIIDIATLTGGQRVALGSALAAVLGTDADLVRRVRDAGSAAGEPAWELPLYPGYRKDLDSQVADLRNVTNSPAASTVMAALFLQEFSGGRPWAHLDIAAPSWSEGEDGWLTKGATGWGTRTLIELVRRWA